MKKIEISRGCGTNLLGIKICCLAQSLSVERDELIHTLPNDCFWMVTKMNTSESSRSIYHCPWCGNKLEVDKAWESL